jgi:hypothetical protein
MIPLDTLSKRFCLLTTCLLILLINATLHAQWYTDPQNPEPQQWGYPVLSLMPDLNGGAYPFVLIGIWMPSLFHVDINGIFTIPDPGVIIEGYSYGEWGWDYLSAVASDNSMIICNTEGWPYPLSWPALLDKWSPEGDHIWSRITFPDLNTIPYEMVADSSGGCIVLIMHRVSMQVTYYYQYFNALGCPRFEWNEMPLFPGATGFYEGIEMIGDGAGGAFVIWSTSSIQMQHIRSDGSFAFGGGTSLGTTGFWSVYPSFTGSFTIMRNEITANEHEFIRFDSLGIPLWNTTLGQLPLWNVRSDTIGGLYFFGLDSTYGRINAEGEVVFRGYPSPCFVNNNNWMATVSSWGELVVLRWEGNRQVWTLQKYDSLGNQVWQHAVSVLYGMPCSGGWCQAIATDARGGVILYFARQDGGYLTRVDAYGNVGSSLHIEPQTLTPSAFTISIFPNPTNSVAYINLSGVLITDPIQIRIYDILGRQANYFQIKSPGQTSISLPLPISNLASGVYFISVENRPNRQSQVQKVIVLK